MIDIKELFKKEFFTGPGKTNFWTVVLLFLLSNKTSPIFKAIQYVFKACRPSYKIPRTTWWPILVMFIVCASLTAFMDHNEKEYKKAKFKAKNNNQDEDVGKGISSTQKNNEKEIQGRIKSNDDSEKVNF